MHINKLEIHNLMRIEALTIDAQGNHVRITGKNASGKSTAVNSFAAILGFLPPRDIPEPIRVGESRADATVDLGEYVAERRWTPSGSVVTVKTRDGSTVRSPQALFDSLMGRFSLDPGAFMRRKPAEQVGDVLTVMGISPPVDEVARITGDNIPAMEGETADRYLQRLVGPRVGAFYVRRTELQRIADDKKRAHTEQVAALLELGGPPSAEEIGADATELHHQLQGAYAEKERAQAAKNAVLGMKSTIEHMAVEKKTIEQSIAGNNEAIAGLIKQREQIDKAIAARQATVKSLETVDLVNKSKAIVALGERHRDAFHAAEALVDPSEKIADLNDRIASANEQSETNAKRQQAADLCTRLQVESDGAQEEANDLDQLIGRLMELGANLLNGLDLGIPGLSVGEGELRLNGISFTQASSAEKIKVACAVAMRQNSTLKVLRIDGGESLDQESQETVFRIASENDYQVFITAVADSEQIKVEIIDKVIDAAPEAQASLPGMEPKKARKKKA